MKSINYAFVFFHDQVFFFNKVLTTFNKTECLSSVVFPPTKPK